mgnify:CR=1 FL=1
MIMQKLVDFIVDIRHEDLPPLVVQESKRVLLDSIGVAIAGLAIDKGKYAVELARRLGGPAESTIVGVGDKVSCTSAAFANGELINALDMDALLIPSHVSPYVIPATLALAESAGASGKDLIIANVLAHELSARLGRAITSVGYATLYGLNLCVIGGAAGAGKVVKLDKEKMAHALGLACYMAPSPVSMRFSYALPPSMVKYAPAGSMAQAEILAVLLAEMGYTGDKGVFDGEHGFWEFMPQAQWDPQRLSDKLGDRWSFLATHYKPYPCCRLMHSGLDGFIKIIEENNLHPEDIEQVKVFSNPGFDFPVFRNREITTSIGAQFSTAYPFAAAAYRVGLGNWQDTQTINDPKIIEFMGKVNFAPHPEFEAKFRENPRTDLSLVEVVAKGQTFRQETMFAKGTHSPPQFRLSDDELVAKFRSNTSRALPQGKVDKAVESLLHLDRSGDK